MYLFPLFLSLCDKLWPFEFIFNKLQSESSEENKSFLLFMVKIWTQLNTVMVINKNQYLQIYIKRHPVLILLKHLVVMKSMCSVLMLVLIKRSIQVHVECVQFIRKKKKKKRYFCKVPLLKGSYFLNYRIIKSYGILHTSSLQVSWKSNFGECIYVFLKFICCIFSCSGLKIASNWHLNSIFKSSIQCVKLGVLFRTMISMWSININLPKHFCGRFKKYNVKIYVYSSYNFKSILKLKDCFIGCYKLNFKQRG